MTVAVEVSVPPEWIAGYAFVVSVTAIEYAMLRYGKATISRLTRHLVHEHPYIAAGIASYLGLHLTLEFRGDPASWLARRFDRRHR